MLRRVVAELGVGGALQAQQGDLAAAGEAFLQRRHQPPREVFVE